MDPKMLQNMIALHKKSYDINFDLEGTKYEPIENIGSGAYGVVCSAVNRKTKDKVAIKKIPAIFDQIQVAKRTFREIKILKHFKHDNVISIREILMPKQSDFKDIYIVLDLMESDLHRIIHSKQNLTDEHVRYFLFQLLRGLKYIHSANVIHRDLKPSNLLVNENCELKIGDFGMARGLSSDVEDKNHALTLYVATRWYRAPELILSCLEYSEAVDVWSVGCILAEMLGRKQIFPGRDTLHQLQIIVDTLGAPPPELLQTSKSVIRDMLKKVSVQPRDMRQLYPNAHPKAVDILQQLLVFNPKSRMSVTKALSHPYLSKYHDPDDEPICIPVFNFDFEKTHMTCVETKDAIVKEIMDYHNKPTRKLTTFNLKPVPKEQLLKPLPREQLLKPVPRDQILKPVPKDQILKPVPKEQILKSVPKEKLLKTLQNDQQSKPGTNTTQNIFKTVSAAQQKTLLPKPAVELSDVSGLEVFIQQQDTLPAPPQEVETGLETFLHQQHLKNLQESLKIKLQGAGKVPPSMANQEVAGKTLQGENTLTKRDTITVDASQPSIDIEMLSAKSVKNENEKGLSVKTEKDKTTGSQDDIIMLSAKNFDGLKLEPDTSLDTEKNSVDTKSMDTKARIKEAILKAGLRKQKLALETQSKPRPVTAYQRQKEREEAKRQKQEKAKERRKKKGQTGKKTQGALLTDEDKNLLARWKNMQTTTKPFVHPIRNHLPELQPQEPSVVRPVGESAGHAQVELAANVYGTQQTQTNVQNQRSQVSQIKTDGQNQIGKVLSQPAASSNQEVPGNIVFTSQGQLPTRNHSSESLDRLFAGVAVVNPIPQQSLMAPIFDSAQQSLSRTDSMPFIPNTTPETVAHPTEANPLWLDQNLRANIPSLQTGLPLPSYTEALQAKVQQSIYGGQVPVVMPGSTLLGASQGESMAQSQHVPANEDSNLPFTLQCSSVSPPHTTSDSSKLLANHSQGSVTPNPLVHPDWLSQLTKGVSRSHIEDLTLAQTPKGTGGGYGVGLDIDSIMQEAAQMEAKDADKDSSRLDSAPLSASLLSEMLNMDAAELEKALQQELGMNSPITFDNLA